MWLLNKLKENKRIWGSSRQWQCQGGVWAVGCQCALVAALSEEGDSVAPVPTAAGHTGLHGQPGLGQYSWTVLPGCRGSVDCLEQEITWQWMENKWDYNKFILFCLYFFCLSFISMCQMEKDKPSQFLVQWHSCFSVRHCICYSVLL